MEAVESPRFIWGKKLVRDLLIREKDFIGSNRMLYLSVLKDAFVKLNIKTVLYTKRVALPVSPGIPYVITPDDYLEYSSLAAPNHHNKLVPMIINTNVKVDVGDLTLAKRCGCDCGCKHDYCSSVRNFEVITGTMMAKMPDGSMRSFNTSYRKIVLKDGSYVEERNVPVEVIQNNVHTDTRLEMQSALLCNLELEECGCVKHNEHNRAMIDRHCQADRVDFECGCAVRDPRGHKEFNLEEEGNKIFLPSDFRQPYVVLRYYANSKTKDLMVPYIAKEAVMSGIKHITSKFDKDAPKAEKEYWERQLSRDTYQMTEDMVEVKLSSFYHAVLR
jgi:hypothetical protein